MIVVKAHFDGRVLVPDEPLDLPPGKEVILRIEPAAERSQNGARQSVLDWAVQNRVDDPSIPTDLSYQHDHYLYGTPKKEPPG